MRKILFGTTALLALAAMSPQRAAAFPAADDVTPQPAPATATPAPETANVKVKFPPTAADVLPLLKKAAAKGKDAAKHLRFAPGSLETALIIVRDGVRGAPRPETSPGKKFPHFLVTTKKGAIYKVKFKRDDLLGRKITITVSKPDAPDTPGDDS
jgi:hypothetical protein